MLKVSKSTSVNGRSVVSVDGKEVTAMTMNATINEDGSVSMSKYIQSKDVYVANKEACDADYSEFETYVNGLLD